MTLNSVQCHVDCGVVFSVVFSEHYIRNKQTVYDLTAIEFLFSCFQINVFNKMFSAQSMYRNPECIRDGLQATVPPEMSPTLMVSDNLRHASLSWNEEVDDLATGL